VHTAQEQTDSEPITPVKNFFTRKKVSKLLEMNGCLTKTVRNYCHIIPTRNNHLLIPSCEQLSLLSKNQLLHTIT